MTTGPLEGTFAETPFPRLLFKVWQREASGRLRLRKDEEEKGLYLEKGQVIINKEGLSEKDFIKALVKKNVLVAEQVRRCAEHVAVHGTSWIRALGELDIISPLPLWNMLESYFVRQLFMLFEWRAGGFTLEPDASLPANERFGLLQTLDLILQGTRQMHNLQLIERCLPA